MNKPVIIIGAGGHAKVLAECLRLQGVSVLGALDKSVSTGSKTADLPILGDDSAIGTYPCDSVELVNGLGSVGDTSLRKKIFDRFNQQGYTFRTVIHPSAIIARDCVLDEGVQVMAGAVINTGTRIAADSIINTGAIIDHECEIGQHVHVAPGVTLSGGVHVADGVHIGTGATVIQGINIDAGALVGAGAVVIRDVEKGAKVAGVPAKNM